VCGQPHATAFLLFAACFAGVVLSALAIVSAGWRRVLLRSQHRHSDEDEDYYAEMDV
jgi:hypothetical protein